MTARLGTDGARLTPKGNRPGRLVVVTGTGTEIGKTWVTAEVATALRDDRRRVAARKPVQSFAVGDPHPHDADRLAAATGERPETVCPPGRSYPLAMAPPMAAAALGLTAFTIGELTVEIEQSWPAPAPEVGFVEAAGGVASPQADDGDAVALIDALDPDIVVLVADAALGTLNLVRLSLAAIGDRPVVVHLNRWDPDDPLQQANHRWLVERDRCRVTTAIAELAAAVVT